ncbi:MAG: hypothetical protein LBR73_04545 [Oscillospiraceae bacterium]|jgi:hypothetical protein|nr:hypothetical protein [Oscillospiraceae bacterium]
MKTFADFHKRIRKNPKLRHLLFLLASLFVAIVMLGATFISVTFEENTTAAFLQIENERVAVVDKLIEHIAADEALTEEQIQGLIEIADEYPYYGVALYDVSQGLAGITKREYSRGAVHLEDVYARLFSDGYDFSKDFTYDIYFAAQKQQCKGYSLVCGEGKILLVGHNPEKMVEEGFQNSKYVVAKWLLFGETLYSLFASCWFVRELFGKPEKEE